MRDVQQGGGAGAMRANIPAKGDPPPYLPAAKNPKRPTVRELWTHVLFLRGELSENEDRYAKTLEGQVAELRDELGALRSDVDIIKGDAEETGYTLDDVKNRLDDIKVEVDDIKSKEGS